MSSGPSREPTHAAAPPGRHLSSKRYETRAPAFRRAGCAGPPPDRSKARVPPLAERARRPPRQARALRRGPCGARARGITDAQRARAQPAARARSSVCPRRYGPAVFHVTEKLVPSEDSADGEAFTPPEEVTIVIV